MEQRLLHFLDKVPDDDAAERWLIDQRWPGGLQCGCGSDNVRRLSRGRYWQRRACRKQFSVTSGTLMHGTKIALRTWVIGIFIVTTSSKGVSARKMAQWLGVSYPTARYMLHRFRATMTNGDPVDGGVEIGVTDIGTRRRSPGRGAGPSLVMTAAGRKGRVVVTRALKSHGRRDIEPAVSDLVARTARVFTDGLPAYKWLGDRRSSVVHSKGEHVRARVHVNTAGSFHSLFQRAVAGVYLWISVKHAGRYAAEAACRWNSGSLSFRGRMTHRGLTA